jgi:hypothetical protein
VLFLLRPPQSIPVFVPPRRPVAPAPVAAPAPDPVARLKELAELHESGALTDEEFATAKRAVLSPG